MTEHVLNRLVSLLFLGIFLVASAPASAASPSADLIRYAPKESKVLIGVNVPAVRGSFLFQDALNFIRSQPANKDVLGFVLQGGFLDVEKDVDGILIATPPATVPTSPQARLPKQDVALIVRGKIDEEKVLTAAKEKYGELTTSEVGKLTVHDAGDFKFIVVDSKTLVLIAASTPFEASTMKALVDAKESVQSDAAMKEVVARIKTSAGIWMATTETPQAPGLSVPPMKDMGLAIDIAGGLKVDVRGKATSEEEAKLMAEQMLKIKEANKDSGTVATLGARPLLENLQVKQSKDRLDIATKMTDAEFKSLIQRLKVLQQAQQGNGFGGLAPATTPSPQTEGSEAPPKSGADADFN